VSAPVTEKLDFTDKDLAFWRAEIAAARQKRTDVATAFGWDDNLKRYIPKAAKDANGALNADVNIGIDFSDVERKKAALFYDTPTVALAVTQDRELPPAEGAPPLPKPLMLSTLVGWQQEILNELLGPQHANVKPTILKAIFNCLCPAGVGPVSVGYQVTMKTVQRPTPVLDEMGQPMMKPIPALQQAGVALGLMPPPMPEPLMEMVPVEVPIYERWFVSGYSPKALLVPASFRDTDFHRAPWMGKEWRKPLSQVRRDYKLPADWTAGSSDAPADIHFEGPEGGQDRDDDVAGDPYVTGVELMYRTALRVPEETHPNALRQLVLVDGKSEPLVHRDSPYQDYSASGEMTRDSLEGFIDRPLVLRDLSDSAWVPSDCAVTAQLTKEVEKYREQSIQQRDTNHNVILFDASKIDPSAKDKIVKGPGGTWVPVIEGALTQGKDTIMAQAAQVSLGRENFMGQDIIMSDREKILGIASNQTGIQSKGRKTATEQSIVQRNSEARFEQERQRVLEWFLDVVSAFDTLVLRYADARIATEILGDIRGPIWAQYKSHLAGGYGYDLSVDSGKYLDIEAERRQILQFYGQVRQDPFVNPRLILQQMASKFGYDPAEFVVEPQKPPQQLKAAITIKGEDLNPQNPAFAIMVELARQGGWQISPGAVQLAQEQSMKNQTMQPGASGVSPHPEAPGTPEHPGMMTKAPTINQHVSRRERRALWPHGELMAQKWRSS
jgi:hypothetical protein